MNDGAGSKLHRSFAAISNDNSGRTMQTLEKYLPDEVRLLP